MWWPFNAVTKQEDIKPPATAAYESLMEQAGHCLKQAKEMREASVRSVKQSCPNVAGMEMDLATRHEDRACILFQEALKFWSMEMAMTQSTSKEE